MVDSAYFGDCDGRDAEHVVPLLYWAMTSGD